MKSQLFTLMLVTLLVALLQGCQRTPEPTDKLIAMAWCSGSLSYRFGNDGSFTMKSATGDLWGGNWSYTQPLTDLEISLRYGPGRLTQIISLQNIQIIDSTLTAVWTDEMATELPVQWQACK